MRSLSPLDQLTVEAFVAALETCREAGVELPDAVWAISQAPEQHVADFSEIAQQHPQLNTAYRTARKLLRQTEGDRQKRIDFHVLEQDLETSPGIRALLELHQKLRQQELEKSLEFRQALVKEQLRLEQQKLETLQQFQAWLELYQQQLDEELRKFQSLFQERLQSLLHEQEVKTVRTEDTLATPSTPAEATSPAIQRIVLAAKASDRDRQNYQKYLEELQRLNPDWVLIPDRPQPDEAEAHLLLYQDENIATRHAAYIATRSLNDFCKALNL